MTDHEFEKAVKLRLRVYVRDLADSEKYSKGGHSAFIHVTDGFLRRWLKRRVINFRLKLFRDCIASEEFKKRDQRISELLSDPYVRQWLCSLEGPQVPPESSAEERSISIASSLLTNPDIVARHRLEKDTMFFALVAHRLLEQPSLLGSREI